MKRAERSDQVGDEAWAEALRRACTRSLSDHGERPPGAWLADIAADVEVDRYGEGGVVAELESEVAALLGMPAAVFMPSGTMAQQIALRIHADRLGRRTIAFHPACHIDVHEGRAYERLHGLVGRPVGAVDELMGLADLEAVAEPLAALVLELPQRDLGGQLPAWDDLVAQTSWARERGAAVHLDGARVWQCGPAYERPLADIAGLFDTVYVSFYKDLGGLSGCGLVGPADVIAQARDWRHRHGGTLRALWPYAAWALHGLRTRLPRMGAYRDHAVLIARALQDLDGVRVIPDPPQTSMMHLHLRTSAAELQDAVRRVAEEDGVWTFRHSAPARHPGWRAVEVAVGESTTDLEPEEIRSIVGRLISG